MPPLDDPLHSDLPQTFERRAFVRYPRWLDMLWQYLGLASRDLTSGHIVNLSMTGVGLLLDQPFVIQSSLAIRLPTRTRGWTTHLVRVKRCVQVDPHQFEVGCTFVKPLSITELSDFVQH